MEKPPKISKEEKRRRINKLAQEAKECEGKIQHNDKAAARVHRDKLLREGADGVRYSIYKCQFCGKFHVGSSRRK